MEGRTSFLWASLFLSCAGCLTGGAQKTAQLPTAAPAAPGAHVAASAALAEPSVNRNDPKRTPRVIVAFAKFKEGEARSLDKNPEQQFKVRHQAREMYQEALKLDGGHVEAHRGLGRIYVDLGDYERATDTFKKAQARFPKESIFWFELGQMHNRKKEFAEAAACLTKALDMEPESRLYVTTLGFTLARAGRTDQSLALLSRSMGPASAHYNVGRMLLHLQKTEEGMRHLHQAVQANPNLDAARQLLREVENGGRVNVNIDIQGGV